MARQLQWRAVTAGVEVELTDHIGCLGPIRAFVIAQMVEGGKPGRTYELNSVWIPCKKRRQNFNSVEEAKRASQEIVDRFAHWIAS